MKLPGELQAITFDVGGTLINPWPSVGDVYAQVAAEHGFHWQDSKTLNENFIRAWRTRENFDYSRRSWSHLVNQTFQDITHTSGEIEFFPQLYERFAKPEVWRVYDDVFPTLEWLQQRGLKLGVISNWDDRLRNILAALKLDRFFRVQIISFEIGFLKPGPEIFQRAVTGLGCPTELVLHIGDSQKEDIEGAEDAGLHSLLIDRSAAEKDDRIISSLDDLRRVLA